MKTKFTIRSIKKISVLFIITSTLIFFTSCQKQYLTTSRDNASHVSQAEADGSFYFNGPVSDGNELIATHPGYTQVFLTWATTYIGYIDSAMVAVPYNNTGVIDSIIAQGDNDHKFKVKFLKNTGKVALNYQNTEITNITFAEFFKALGGEKGYKYTTGIENQLCLVAIRVNGIWHRDSVWSGKKSYNTGTFKLVGSKPKVELDSAFSPIRNDGSNNPSMLARIRLKTTGDWVSYDSLLVIINYYHAPIETNAFLLVDSVTSFTFGHVRTTKIIRGPYNNIAIIKLSLQQNGKPFKVDSGSVRTVYLLGVINKKDNHAWATLGMGDPAKMGWRDDTYPKSLKELNTGWYFINNHTDYANNQVSLKWEF